MSKEPTIASQRVFAGHAIRVRVDTIHTTDGRETTREIVEHNGAVAIVAVENEDTILLVKQYRKAIEEDLLEIPAGGIDEGEDPETTVRREMSEETGFEPQTVVRLGGFYSAPGFCTEYLYLYLATDLIPKQLYAEDTDGITLVRVSLPEIPQLISSGQIHDAKSIAGLLTYLEYRKQNG